jgi:antirestriction protein ArdC
MGRASDRSSRRRRAGPSPAHFYGRPQPLLDPARHIAAAEAFFAATGADIRSGGAEACYVIGLDCGIRLAFVQAHERRQ